ncbi:hypothetical protein FOPG_00041 [Fusarium oxysporum f. sp. conglutinans race 2 54008]|uniref:Uncharacterized protein n=1 Tax=Fusarium oxysporum f. sp. conglutinans race 2 54008 TaxID=1089457 RepID=X0IKA0_FUSOX|nr:hypothetical protein FOPG_00041 [Fusarium oxysporum f. sp. conglutinans race 2 54008]
MNVQLRSLSNYLASSPATLLQCSISAIQSLWYDFTVGKEKKKKNTESVICTASCCNSTTSCCSTAIAHFNYCYILTRLFLRVQYNPLEYHVEQSLGLPTMETWKYPHHVSLSPYGLVREPDQPYP